ncbi:MAG: N-acetyltransferase [Desulfarculus sp.]|nr:N-acetyltransferase [Desulfarculus sp.]
MLIRDETPSDIAAIDSVTIAAFADHPFSQQTEQFIVKALRAAGALTVSLVAEIEGQVKGHIAFSPVTIAQKACGWYGMGPVSVLPARQRQGIGSALVREGLGRLRALSARGCALVGPPEYYQRFGFHNHPALVHEGIPQEFFLVLPLGDSLPQGAVAFHEAFAAKA